MTPDEPGPRRRHGAVDLPPYAPRPAEPEPAPQPLNGSSPTSAAAGSTSAPATPAARTPAELDFDEEAAAYAEAREQGVLPADYEPPAPATDIALPVAESTPEPEAASDTEADPPTIALPAVGVDEAAEVRARLHAPPEPTTAIVAPPVDISEAERKGAAKEAARQARQERAAAKLAAAKAGGFRNEPVRTIVRGIGQTLITFGVVLLLFVVYEVYVTDLFGAQHQEQAKETMEQRWEAATPTETLSSADTVVATTSTPPVAAEQVTPPEDRVRKYTTEIGQGFANIFIPAFGADYTYTIVEGTTAEDLYGSPGHYDDTQYPGELGNFAVAGHRVSKGSPFNALGTLNSCDAVVIETRDDWFVYRVLPMDDEQTNWNPASRPECADVAPLTGEYQGLAGREITLPTDYAQVLPVPKVDRSGADALAAATQRIITLTTCHPQFSDKERMIVHGVLTKSYAKADGFLPPELSES